MQHNFLEAMYDNGKMYMTFDIELAHLNLNYSNYKKISKVTK